MKFDLSDYQAETLRKLAAEPFTFSSDWATDGLRRQIFFFANSEGERLPLPRVSGLAAIGLVLMDEDPKDAEKFVARATPEGLALLAKMEAHAHG